MTLTQNGLNYICENFGDLNLCCVRTGLSWYFITGKGERLDETGGTAEIVSRLVSGLAETLTMVSPDRGTFTIVDILQGNDNKPVTLEDAKLIAEHDDVGPLEQWCYGAKPPLAIPWGLILGIGLAAVAGVIVWQSPQTA